MQGFALRTDIAVLFSIVPEHLAGEGALALPGRFGMQRQVRFDVIAFQINNVLNCPIFLVSDGDFQR